MKCNGQNFSRVAKAAAAALLARSLTPSLLVLCVVDNGDGRGADGG